MGKTPSSKYNYCAGKLVQMCHVLQQLHAALIAVALQSSHSTNDCVFTQIGHHEDEELSFFLSLCGFFFRFGCRVMQTTLDDVQQNLG